MPMGSITSSSFKTGSKIGSDWDWGSLLISDCLSAGWLGAWRVKVTCVCSVRDSLELSGLVVLNLWKWERVTSRG